MTTSVVSICNTALDLLGSDSITSLADDSKAARFCARNYERVRDAVLRAYPFLIATVLIFDPAFPVERLPVLDWKELGSLLLGMLGLA
jgi:hypothetical protein